MDLIITILPVVTKDIFPSLPGSRLSVFYRDASSALLQLVNQWLHITLLVLCLASQLLLVIGCQSHVLQRCTPVCGHQGYSHISPVLVYLVRFLIAMQVQHLLQIALRDRNFKQIAVSYEHHESSY